MDPEEISCSPPSEQRRIRHGAKNGGETESTEEYVPNRG